METSAAATFSRGTLETAAPGHRMAGTEMPPQRSSICGRAGPAPALSCAFLGSANTLQAKTLVHTLSPALERLGAVRDQRRLGVPRESLQLSKFKEGEKRAKGTGRTLLPLPSSRSKSPWD